MTRHPVFRRVVMVVVVVFFSAAARAADIRIVGSDLLGLEFFKALYAFAGAESIPVALALDGSRTGLDQLKAGRAELALLTLPPGDDIDAAVFADVPLGWHCVVVVVPSAAPLHRVDFFQLAAIFGADRPVNYQRWGELGPVGEWAGSTIAPFAPAVGQNLTAEIFRDAVLRGKAIKAHVGRYTSSVDLSRQFGGESRGIALSPALAASAQGTRRLPVAVRANAPAYFPTPESLQSGDYPLRLPLRVVYRRHADGTVRPLLRFLFSDSVAQIFERAGIVPQPVAARRQHELTRGFVEGEILRK